MGAFRSIVFRSVAAGVIVGILLTVAHHFGTVPLILKSEVYERASEAASVVPAAGHAHATTNLAQPHTGAQETEHAHEHGTAAWEPAEGFERTAYTAGADILAGIGFALLLSSAYVISGRKVTWHEGLLWGIAGFAVFTLAPGLGLPPELPGMPATELGPRQIWWIATATATALGLGVLVFVPSVIAAVTGVALIVAPHVLGAPPPADVASNVPESLWREFIVAVTVTSFLFWAALGGITGALHQRFSRD